MDYFVWGAVERHTNKTPCNNKDELVKRIKKEFKALKDLVIKSCARFRTRISGFIKLINRVDFIKIG